MGLDSVELLLATEEAFDISIADEEAWEIKTVKQLEDVVLAKLHVQGASTQTRPHCLSSFSFYRFRAAIQKHAGIPRRSVTPTSNLQDILPLGNRRAVWLQLGRELGWRLPALQRPAWLNYSFAVLFAGIVFMTIGLYFLEKLSAEFCVLLSPMVISIFVVAYRGTAPFATQLPSPTVSGLLKRVLDTNFGRIRSQHEAQFTERQAWRTDEARQTVRRIVAEQLCVALEEVIPSARFVEDLHMD